MKIKKILIIVLVIVLIGILFLKINNLFYHQKYFSDSKNNFKDVNFNSIESWMSPKMIGKKFDLNKKDIEEILGDEIKFKDEEKPIDEYCRNKKIDCDIIVEKLNNKIKDGN